MTNEDVWRIVDGPDPAHPDGVDAQGWIWTIEHLRSSERRRFRCVVTGPGAKAHDRARKAVETSGRSEVKRVLADEEPPEGIELTGAGPM